MGLSGPKFCLKQRHVLLEGCHPAHFQQCVTQSPTLSSTEGVERLFWGRRVKYVDQRHSDGPKDFSGSSVWPCCIHQPLGRQCGEEARPVDVDSAERRGEGWAELLGQQDPQSWEKEGKTGKTAGRLKSKPAFNFSQTTWSWCPMPYILTGIYSRPLPASDTDGDRNIQVLFAQIFWRCFPCGTLCWQRQLAKSTKPNFVTELLISIWRKIEGKKWL